VKPTDRNGIENIPSDPEGVERSAHSGPEPRKGEPVSVGFTYGYSRCSPSGNRAPTGPVLSQPARAWLNWTAAGLSRHVAL
jgi:hypothetical protein